MCVVVWLFHMCDIVHSCVSCDLFIRMTFLVHVCDVTLSYAWHCSFRCVMLLFHMCDLEHSCMSCDSFTCVTLLIRVCDITRGTRKSSRSPLTLTMRRVCNLWPVSTLHLWTCEFMCVIWLFHIRDIAYSYVWLTLLYAGHNWCGMIQCAVMQHQPKDRLTQGIIVPARQKSKMHQLSFFLTPDAAQDRTKS